MKTLVAYGSKLGGTREIAERIGATLRKEGFEVEVMPAHDVRDARKYGAVIVGGGLYAGRWHGDASQLVIRGAMALRERHVWFFSSGPLDASASASEIAPVPQVAALLAHVGGHGHVTFGGRLAADATGFIASKMAKHHAGDWRDMQRVDVWAGDIARELAATPTLAPRPPSAFAPLPSRGAVASLCLFAGLSAIGGGIGLIASPDGTLLRLPRSVLDHSPFTSFLVPGLLLFAVIGLGNVWSAALHLLRRDAAPFASLVTGIALAVWTIAEVAMLRSFNLLHAACLVVGGAIAVLSLRTIATMFPKPPGERPFVAPNRSPA
jgi:menaquinone-dependent protoporphyrinogen oxidase